MSARRVSSVFINVPFDRAYEPLLQAIIFAVSDCGFVARSALEIDDGSQIRIQKICEIMSQCDFGIHDISRTEVGRTGLPRFNMPLELGLFLGAKRFGKGRQRRKNCLILDRHRYRFHKFCSDIAGQDIRAHGNRPARVIARVRDWLASSMSSRGIMVPGPVFISRRYAQFLEDLPAACRDLGLRVRQLTFNDFRFLVSRWLLNNPW